jgi:hypothetical protein
MTTGPAPVCRDCRWYDRDNEDGLTCRAFPDGLPDALLFGVNDHTEPLPGDRGYRFEPLLRGAERAWLLSPDPGSRDRSVRAVLGQAAECASASVPVTMTVRPWLRYVSMHTDP